MHKPLNELLLDVQQRQAVLDKVQAALDAVQEPFVLGVQALAERYKALFEPAYKQLHGLKGIRLRQRSEEHFGRHPYNSFIDTHWFIEEEMIVVSGRFYAGCGEYDQGEARVPLRYLGEHGRALMEQDAERKLRAVQKLATKHQEATKRKATQHERALFEELKAKFEGEA